jgi:signal transduction histidine kinase
MEAATERMGGMVEELLDAARLDAGQALELRRAPTDLVALIERVIEEQRTATPNTRSPSAPTSPRWSATGTPRASGACSRTSSRTP